MWPNALLRAPFLTELYVVGTVLHQGIECITILLHFNNEQLYLKGLFHTSLLSFYIIEVEDLYCNYILVREYTPWYLCIRMI